MQKYIMKDCADFHTKYAVHTNKAKNVPLNSV